MADGVRLIDAEALKNYMCSACPNKGRCEDTEQVCSAILDVDEQPTIEAEPVKHGRWEINCDGYYPYCSNCKNEPQGREMTLYCPNCGSYNGGDE